MENRGLAFVKNGNWLFASLPFVFFIGFVLGSLWQTMMFRVALHGFQPKVEMIAPAPPTEEEKITQAMEDPEFKRVHDFLMRENPIQMNLDIPENREKSEAPTRKTVPDPEKPKDRPAEQERPDKS